MNDIGEWLAQLGLAKYEQVFAENDIGLDVVADLSDSDLKELGVSLGDRKRLMKHALALPQDSAIDESLRSSKLTSVDEAEHRQLTVMFCDLVGSVELGEQMDVEDYRDLLSRFRKVVVDAVQRYDGFVARHAGDGLLAYFGFPQAHEEDAERAVRAGLDTARDLRRLEHPYDAKLRVRVGIATGVVVVGDVLTTGASEHCELAALGPTPNLAARLQSEASPDGILVSATTHKLVTGHFTFQRLIARKVKGILEEITPYRVTGELSGQTRFDARASGRLSRFVGREEEIELLHRRWMRANDGHGQVVLLAGEAGIGKSRLLRWLRDDITVNHEFIHLQCSPYHASSPLYPVIAAFEKTLRAIPVTAKSSLKRLRLHLEEVGENTEGSLTLLAELLSIPERDELSPLLGMSASRRRELTLRTLVEYIQRLAEKKLVLCAFEDVHWADPSSRELLGRLVESDQDQRVLIAVTTRPGFDAVWSDQAHVSVRTLPRLGEEAGGQLARAVATAATQLPVDIVDTILQRSGGNPLFIEELTRTVVESSGSSPIEKRKIPETLQDSLTARLDVLEFGKPVAQCASVIGDKCSHSLLESVWEDTPELLEKGLLELKDAGLIYTRGEADSLSYAFKHSLVKDNAYGILLRDHRVTLHRRTAEALEHADSTMESKQPEILAYHYAEAGVVEKAVVYWHRAGQRSLQGSANAEAVNYITRGLELVTTLPESAERHSMELGLELSLGPALMNTRGSGSADVAATYERARQLSDLVMEPKQKFVACWGLFLHHIVSGRPTRAREFAKETVTIGSELRDSTYALQGYHAAWTTDDYIGNHAQALAHTNDGISLYEIDRHRASAALYGDHDAGVCGHVHKAYNCWFLGYPDQAVVSIDESVDLAEKLEHPPSFVLAKCSAAMIYQLRGDPKAVLREADQLIDYSTHQELNSWKLNGEILHGWALYSLGHEDGVEQMRVALKKRDVSGSKLRQVYYTSLYAALLGDLGEAHAGLEAIARAQTMLEDSEERRWEPLVHCVNARLLCATNEADRAETSWHTALESAGGRSAKSFELMAANGLARLYLDRGDFQQAGDILTPVYNWFNEGFETADLTKAKALCQELREL